LQQVISQLASGHLGFATIAIWTVITALLAILGGALTGMQLAGKDLGRALAASMGAMFGPTAVVPGLLLGLVILTFL
jgi:hypothetical protein